MLSGAPGLVRSRTFRNASSTTTSNRGALNGNEIPAYSAFARRLKKSTKVRVKPQKGELRQNGLPKTAADKRTEALEVCLAFERAEVHAKNGTLTEQTAKKIIGEILERTTGDRLVSHTAGGWLAHWLELKEKVRRGKTVERYRQVIRDFVASLGNRADLSLAHITSRDVLAFRNGIIARGNRARTANLSLEVISAAFNAALRQQHIAHNPCTALEALEVKAEEKGTFTPEQVTQLLRAAEGDWRGAILLGYYTGARLSDVATCAGAPSIWARG